MTMKILVYIAYMTFKFIIRLFPVKILKGASENA